MEGHRHTCSCGEDASCSAAIWLIRSRREPTPPALTSFARRREIAPHAPLHRRWKPACQALLLAATVIPGRQEPKLRASNHLSLDTRAYAPSAAPPRHAWCTAKTSLLVRCVFPEGYPPLPTCPCGGGPLEGWEGQLRPPEVLNIRFFRRMSSERFTTLGPRTAFRLQHQHQHQPARFPLGPDP